MKKNTAKSEDMRRHIEACQASGQTVIAYCEAHKISKSGYYYWYKRLYMEHGKAGFIPIEVEAAQEMSTELRFPNGVTIRFNGPASASYLKELICCI